MATKLVTRVLDASDAGLSNCWAKVYYDAELGEFQVKFYKETQYMKGADYFTPEKQDAIATAKASCIKGW